MSVGTSWAMPPATPPPAPPPMVGMGRSSPGAEFAGDLAHGLNQLLGHPADRGKNLAQWQAGKQGPALPDAVFALAGGSFFQRVIHLVADPAGFLNSLPHGKNQARNGHLRPLLKVQALGVMMTNPIPAPGFS